MNGSLNVLWNKVEHDVDNYCKHWIAQKKVSLHSYQKKGTKVWNWCLLRVYWCTTLRCAVLTAISCVVMQSLEGR